MLDIFEGGGRREASEWKEAPSPPLPPKNSPSLSHPLIPVIRLPGVAATAPLFRSGERLFGSNAAQWAERGGVAGRFFGRSFHRSSTAL